MIDITKTDEYDTWLKGLKDSRAKARIASRTVRFAFGNLGDVKPVGGGISEARIDYGPGYRVYFQQRGAKIILLLCGGTKKNQQADIERAIELSEQYT